MDSDTVRRILMDAPGDALCEVCLAAIGGLAAGEVRAVTLSLLTNPDEFGRAYACASCARGVAAVFFRAKCAHCSVRLYDGDKGFRMGEEIFHVGCIRRLISDENIRLSKALGRRSRRLIAESRRRLRRGQDGTPLETP